MFNEYLKKNCIAVVAFSSSLINGGVTTVNYIGTLISENEDYIVLDVDYSKCESSIGVSKTIKGITYINKKYLVAINFNK